MWTFSRRKPKLKKLLAGYLSYFFGKIICSILEELPLSLTRPVLGKLCRFTYYLLPRERKLALSHLWNGSLKRDNSTPEKENYQSNV